MRMSTPLVQQLGQQLKFQTASMDNRPAICWLSGTFSPNVDPMALTPHVIRMGSYKAFERLRFRYFVREDGTVGDVDVVESSGNKQIDDTAITTVKGWHFRPALRDGKAAGVWLYEVSGSKFVVLRNATPGPEPIALTSHFLGVEDYPRESLRRQEQGSVSVRFSVETDGIVRQVEIVSSSGKPRLDEAAALFIKKKWLYEPAVRDGKPVRAQLNATVIFQLQ